MVDRKERNSQNYARSKNSARPHLIQAGAWRAMKLAAKG
jgi:hypothetical protein